MNSYLAALVLLASSSSAQVDGITGLWLTDDKQGVVSISTCKKNKKKYCGYLIRFRETGNKKMNRKLCGTKLIGDMSYIGKRFTGGWIYSPEDSQAYNLVIHPKSAPGKILLRAYGNKLSDGENFTWTRYFKNKDKRAVSYWAQCKALT